MTKYLPDELKRMYYLISCLIENGKGVKVNRFKEGVYVFIVLVSLVIFGFIIFSFVSCRFFFVYSFELSLLYYPCWCYLFCCMFLDCICMFIVSLCFIIISVSLLLSFHLYWVLYYLLLLCFLVLFSFYCFHVFSSI